MNQVFLFGNPLRRQHSAVMHNAAFDAFDVDARYALAEVSEDELRALVPCARNRHWLGFQITAPYKQTVMTLLDEVQESARQIGAVNSVEVTAGGRLVGFNTDTTGFVTAVRRELGIEIAGRRVVVAGTGGAARAVVHGLLREHAAAVTVVSRDARSGIALAADFAELGSIEPMSLDDERLVDRLAAAELFVNATSVGMLSPGPVIPVDRLSPTAGVFDLVYVPRETELVRQARAAGLTVANGAEMLIAQAAEAFVRWTGRPDPSQVMRKAVRPLLDDPAAVP
ncbi:shikimate dehydrogenase [Nakamurella lactea]|uniref:shikimate dehydrogenase n=1 Tax=Nakamurella lactea TaxID=459515 RepID=UPI0003F9401F|nr:shikimate dehydrogenase [Nakamurella lactea]